jgi:uncharacterized protein involved in type VI secretion and phage assembly
MDERTEDLVVELAEQARRRYWGKYRGTVEDPDDPEQLGRIVAKVPSVYGDLNSPWAFPVAPLAGPGYGFVTLPKQGDGVWIEFEAGDPSHPLWTGFWWARGDLPAPAGVDTRVLVTPAGLKIVLDDGAKKLQLLHPGGAELTLTDQDITLKIASAKVVLSSAGVAINDTAFKVS